MSTGSSSFGRISVAASSTPMFVPTGLNACAKLSRRVAVSSGPSDSTYGLADVSRMDKRLQRRTRGFIRLGKLVPRRLLDRALRDEARHTARIGELFRDHDVLLTPTIARLPVRAARWEGLGALRTLLEMAPVYPFTPVWNMTGQPAISIPAPPSRDGLPIGAQLIAPAHGEERLLGLAAQLERELRWPARRPTVA